MTYEPAKQDIADKTVELIEEWLAVDDQMADALIDNVGLVRKLMQARGFDQIADAKFDLQMALNRYAIAQRDFYSDAQDALIAETGYTLRTAVDDAIFVVHNTEF